MSGSDFAYTMGDPLPEETPGVGGRQRGLRASRVRRIRILQQQAEANAAGENLTAQPATPTVDGGQPDGEPRHAGLSNAGREAGAAKVVQADTVGAAESPGWTLPWTEPSIETGVTQPREPVGLGLIGKDLGDDS
jgi:hypothetical protein